MKKLGKPGAEAARLAEDSGQKTGSAGDLTSPSGNGARCARTIRRTATAGSFFPHDHARSRAYRWGEDGLLGFTDRECRLCFALALWNGRDPILKERLFGLTGNEGNHGEDVKEDYFYLDSTPTHSYVKSLYKYPQAEFPYARLVAENRHRSREQPEFELADTGVFDEHRYFDVFAEYAKGGPDDLLIRITVHNRGPDTASLHVLPTVWFRNTWAWSADPGDLVRPQIAQPTPRLSWRHTNPSEPFTSPPGQGRTKNCRSSCSPRTKPIPSCSSARRTKAGTPRTPSTTT